MHELSIAQSLVEELERAARHEGASAVTRVAITVGRLSGVEPEALRMAFPLAAEGTPVEGAELDMEMVPARVHCPQCGDDTAPPYPFMACGTCGSSDIEVISGRELLIQSAELSVPSA